MSPTDQIRLSLPAADEYGRLARITAAGLALRLGFSYAEIQDLRLALDEALISLLHPGEHPGVITVVFDADNDGEALTVTATATADDSEHDDDALTEVRERLETIVAPIVERLEIDDDLHRVQLTMRRKAES